MSLDPAFEPRDSPDEVLSAVGHRINQVDCNGETPVMTAIVYNNYEQVKCLIEHKANVNFSKNLKETPLDVAIHKKNLKIIALLFQNGADLTQSFHFTNEIVYPNVKSCVQHCRRNQLMSLFPGPKHWTGPEGGLLGLPIDVTKFLIKFIE